MSKCLNLPLINTATEENGLTQTAIARQLGVTKAAVSKWLTGKSLPRAPELLKLGKLLNLRYADLVQTTDEPLIAFRKRGACKTTPAHVQRAKNMGHFLEPLVEYLDFDAFIAPGSLKAPSDAYSYIQSLVTKLRREVGISDSEPIKFEDLIAKFQKHQAVIIPTLWGKKHENALHVYLPKSKTTWIYLNLDSELHDFKFWMAHELAHVLSVSLLEKNELDLAEDFADHFAGALLFPEKAAKKTYEKYASARTERARINELVMAAEKYQISPNSVYKELGRFAGEYDQPFKEVRNDKLFPAITQFNKQFPLLSETLFDGETPSADHFMRVAQEQFETHFYKALGEFIRATDATPATISRIMDIPLLDAKSYYEALTTTG
ncbi:MAG: transcriptional regulator [Puniceicoccaceae bacterium]|nr:transcriptional regulator [Puniceicoccaceae bacterium]|tara:strand:+ start:8537 stop:9673 length:1137 start_codon:yes stop_codon:yes gene_type:complete